MTTRVTLYPWLLAAVAKAWEDGASDVATAHALGLSPSSVTQVRRHLGLPPARPKPVTERPGVKARRCLMCTRSFTSLGAGNRVCGNCKQTRLWQAGVAF